MNRKFIVVLVLIVIVIILIAVGVWVGVKLIKPNPAGPSPYSAVYLTSGDVYFGKLSWFPWPRLRNVWFLQRGVDEQNQPQLGIAPLTGAFWGPVDTIYLNPGEILFWTRLRNDSQLASALASPASVSPLPQQQPAVQPPAQNNQQNATSAPR